MKTPVIDQSSGPGPDSSSDASQTRRRSRPEARRRRSWMLVGVAAAAVVSVAGVQIVRNRDTGPEAAAGPPLELSLPANDSMAMCLPLEVALLAQMSPAFGGTVTSVDSSGLDAVVSMDVDRWYAGGDAATVELHAPVGMQALIDGFDFEVGQRYLVTASEGSVNYCGFSGLANPELTAAFEQAFAG